MYFCMLVKVKILNREFLIILDLTLKKKDDLKIKDSVAKIKFKETGSDIVAQLLECQEIKDLKPLYNRALRRRKFPFFSLYR